MKTALRWNLIVTALLLCVLFFFCGVVGINDETNYVITGEKAGVVKAESVSDNKVFKMEFKDKNSTAIVEFNKEKLEEYLHYAKYCTYPPFGDILWGVEKLNSDK